ncbi:hypothetical protein LCGC14_0441830 [marine sediment metagenome]|uniref:Uncharacterized protein n=1 Tax=marine sediment metagenome TaxID=412755 RepID=A0A0F9SR37_9ZZZZ
MITKRTGWWIFFNIFLGAQFIGLIFETIRDSYSWLYAVIAALLIVGVNMYIYSEGKEKLK